MFKFMRLREYTVPKLKNWVQKDFTLTIIIALQIIIIILICFFFLVIQYVK